MSAYVNFYLRVNENFAPLGSYSRSSQIYKIMGAYLPWEKIVALDVSTLQRFRSEVEDILHFTQKDKDRGIAKCKSIMDAANTPLEEKLSAVANIEDNLKELDEYIEELNDAISIFSFFIGMIEDFKYYPSEYCSFKGDADHYLYAGIEAIGSIENIVEE